MKLSTLLEYLEEYIVIKTHSENRNSISEEDYKQAFGCFYALKNNLVDQIEFEERLSAIKINRPNLPY